jgi:hypothetical protein
MFLPKKSNSMRLTHQARAANAGDMSVPLHVLDDALRDSVVEAINSQRRWPLIATPVAPVLDPSDDRLFIEQTLGAGELITKIELTRNGVLRLQEYVEPEIVSSGTGFAKAVSGRECFFYPGDIARRMVLFAELARTAFIKIASAQVYLSWILEDANQGVCIATSGWITSQAQEYLMTEHDLCRCPEEPTPTDISAARHAAAKVVPALRELLFSFQGTCSNKAITRIRPSDAAMADLFRSLNLS